MCNPLFLAYRFHLQVKPVKLPFGENIDILPQSLKKFTVSACITIGKNKKIGRYQDY